MIPECETKVLTGTVAALHLSPKRGEAMRPVERVIALADRGFEGCAHARAGTKRQLLLIDQETLDELGLPSGIVKENVTTKGIALQTLPIGTRIRIGENAAIEITMPCDPCRMLDGIRPGLKDAMQGKRGVLARVVTGGTVMVGDPISVVESSFACPPGSPPACHRTN